MGTQNTKGLSRQIQSRKQNQKQIPTEYQPFYQRCQVNQNFFHEILIQNSKFTNNLLKYFPNCLKNYEQFAEMVTFLRKIQFKPEKSLFAKYNAPKTTLIDRYFMIVMGIDRWQELDKIHLNFDQIEDLFMQFMKLFMPNPKKGFIEKLYSTTNTITIKQFGKSLRDNFTQVYKHLRDYMQAKFRDMVKQAYLLSLFKSDIIQEDAMILSLKIPELTGKQIKKLYSSQNCGLSFHSYEKRIIGYDGPWLLLIQSVDKEVYKFGSFQSGPIRDIIDYQGDLRGFMFSIEPTIRFMTTDKGDHSQHYFFINTLDQKLSKKRRGIGFGGDRAKQNCKLWIDQDLDKSTVFNGNDPTYGFGSLANPMSTALSIRKMQIWGLGSKFDLEKQAQYWQQRQQQAMKRRKVNKKELLDGNAGMIFEKTFAHRDQVVGQIQRTKKSQS